MTSKFIPNSLVSKWIFILEADFEATVINGKLYISSVHMIKMNYHKTLELK